MHKLPRAASWEAQAAYHVLGHVLGTAWDKVGAYIVGGFALTLLHRHDIRVGAASGEYLRSAAPGATPVRLEILAVVFLCHWRRSTSSLRRSLARSLPRFQRADSAERADRLKGAWSSMEADMHGYQVVGYRDECKVELVLRQQRSRIRNAASGAIHAYHPCRNPQVAALVRKSSRFCCAMC